MAMALLPSVRFTEHQRKRPQSTVEERPLLEGRVSILGPFLCAMERQRKQELYRQKGVQKHMQEVFILLMWKREWVPLQPL